MQGKLVGLYSNVEKKSNPSPIYIGQSVYISHEKTYGIFIGYDKDKNYNNCWVFHLGPDGEYDQFGYELDDLGYVLEPDKETVSGTRLYYGPFRKKEFAGTLSEKYVEDNQRGMIKEVEALTKLDKKNEKNNEKN